MLLLPFARVEMTHGATHGPELMTSLVSVVDAILKQGELSVHEAVAQVAKEHNAKLSTVGERIPALR
jgi:hypothetical protein